MKILHVVGARPNFMKAAPVIEAFWSHEGVEQFVVHTGQHYDHTMSEIFFRQLQIRSPDLNLGVGSGSHARQTAQIMSRFEPVLQRERPDLVLVYGDINSTMAAALVCAKALVAVGHVEAGLRSFDRSMPEEVNRVVTDRLCDLLFTPSADANENLLREGIDPSKIHFVGNVMIDTLCRLTDAASSSQIIPRLSLRPGGYGLVTLHRPSNVDEPDTLSRILTGLKKVSEHLPIVFPVHPRTRERMTKLEVAKSNGDLHLVEPLGYLDFMALQKQARLVITDSGGVQEETTYLGVPCLTVRGNTERPVTVELGTNTLVGTNMQRLRTEVEMIMEGQGKRGTRPPLWDGNASQRIVRVILSVRLPWSSQDRGPRDNVESGRDEIVG